MKAFLFDCETSGLIENRTVKLDKQPFVLEFYGCLADLKKGKVLKEVSYLIQPPDPALVTDEITRITGIKYDDLKDAPQFKAVAPKIFEALEKAPAIIAHNLSFDREMIDIESERLGHKMKWPKRQVCSVEQTIHVKGYRLSLSALHEYLFQEKFEGAHRARVDVMALLRCCRELHKRDMI